MNRTGALAPDYAFGGQEKQRALLEAEGVTFLADGRNRYDAAFMGQI